MTMRVAIYARYSSDLQSQASIEDQVRLCAEKAAVNGWEIYNTYTDAGISGASLMRPGIQALMSDAMNGAFDVVVCEAMDRLSRDQEDIAGLYKRMEFAGVKIITLSEGEIDTMHIGLKGTMNAMFLKDLADKTRRGLRGKVESGKSGGGIGYGYKVVKRFDASGEAIKGDREINHDQARIVNRIFKEYANDNKSPKAIAAQFNKEGIPSPSGGQWTQSTINGNRKRGTGILNNELYIGRLIWNRQRFIKNPGTGKRVTRMNEEKDWIIQEVPELRIVPQALWEAAKARQTKLNRKGDFNRKTRPQYLLSGLLKCGQCGGGYSKINSTRYGCSAARNKGESVCNNKLTVKRESLESSVLDALETHLMRGELLKVFCAEFTRHLNNLRRQRKDALSSMQKEQRRLVKERESLIQAIKDGIPASAIKDELLRVTEAQEELEDQINAHNQHKDKPLVHPSMARLYHQQIKSLRTSLEEQAASGEAREHIRALIEKIVLAPKAGQNELSIDLYGNLAEILTIASEDNDMKKGKAQTKPPGYMVANDNYITGRSVNTKNLVAGAGFEPTTFGL